MKRNLIVYDRLESKRASHDLRTYSHLIQQQQ